MTVKLEGACSGEHVRDGTSPSKGCYCESPSIQAVSLSPKLNTNLPRHFYDIVFTIIADGPLQIVLVFKTPVLITGCR